MLNLLKFIIVDMVISVVPMDTLEIIVQLLLNLLLL